MIEKSQRPLIDRPRYISKPPKVAKAKPNNKPVNKKDLNKRQLKRPNKRVINKQMQPPVSGSAAKIDEAVKAKPSVKPPVKPSVKPKPARKRKTKKPPMPPREPEAPKEEKKDDGLFKQMRDKFVGKPKDEGGNLN